MRAMKTKGGLTGGRGVTDSTLSRWVLAMPACGHISDAVEQSAGVSSATSEQHIDLRESRKVRDKSDVHKIIDWFKAHSPLHQTPPELISLFIGIVADDETNCEQAYEFGQSEMTKLTKQTFIDVHYSRKRRVKSLTTSSMGVKLRNDVDDVIHSSCLIDLSASFAATLILRPALNTSCLQHLHHYLITHQ